MGLHRQSGRAVIKPKYHFGYDSGDHAFSERLALVYLEQGCDYDDKTDRLVIKFRCDEADRFSGGLAYVHVGRSAATCTILFGGRPNSCSVKIT